MSQNAIEIKNLKKTYNQGKQGEVKALHSISLEVKTGSIFGLLGPNGAGKSTLINIMAGLTTKTSGQVSIWGFDMDANPRQSRGSIGVVPQELNFDPFFPPIETLEQQAGLYGVPKSERRSMEILEAIGLGDKAHAYSRSLSGGMKRRLLVAKALVHNPPVLILDEPTAGVDVQLRRQMWDYVRELNARGTTIVLTTHYLEEAQELCDQIAIIDHGKLITNEPTQQLLARVDGKRMIVTPKTEIAVAPDLGADIRAELDGFGNLVIDYAPKKTEVMEIIAKLQNQNIGIKDISTEEAGLEEIFLQLTGND
ncbi:MAG: ABC transporter ATP-binding protein [Rhizobiales bacterium]|nr:ABC transporter ATP-binding protein [Hyphomicrobiales bacterium]NRB13254.1 ABC transporter ATP-binding protein [Hyphomicrobiales bacterium]